MLREGMELSEAALFARNALEKKKDLLPLSIKNTGWTVSEYADATGVRWTVLTFTNNGTLEVAKDGFVDVLVVGSGGGGGGTGNAGNGGSGIVILRYVVPPFSGSMIMVR